MSDDETNHYLSQKFGFGTDSEIFWSKEPDGSLVVFVHGFKGHPIRTWKEFPEYVSVNDSFKGSDIIFYGHESGTRAMFLAVDFFNAMDSFLQNPSNYCSKNILENRKFDLQYSKVIFVGHSLGAVICRQALLEGVFNKKEWLERVRLVLFAPAHKGADFYKFPGISKFFKPLLRDLEEGSEFLKDMLDRSQKEIREKKSEFLVARKVIFGGKDRYVSVNRFADDPTPITVPDKGHSDICKPKPKYMLPLLQVAEVL